MVQTGNPMSFSFIEFEEAVGTNYPGSVV